ncbi:RHS repeat-associated core domain-containing protein [Flavobacterium columnare]|uniref:RHS repeat-associated core domain-containing protein n=1 Tax=Flavobacterium columnare TaxID=996 RepID=UPI004034B95D
MYGKTRKIEGDQNLIPFLYQGQYYDHDIELAYNRFRYYNPETGLYLSQDPIRLLGGNPNLYAYVKNTNAWIDIFGLDCKVKVTAGDGVTHDIVATIKKSDFPETAQHIEDAIKKGHPDIVTVDRLNAAAQRTKSLKGIPTKKGFDRDEWPMAMFKEGGSGASVRYINPSDNSGAGSAVGSALSDYPNDTRVLIKIID